MTTVLEWDDSPSGQWDTKAPTTLTARVLPSAKDPTEIELLGNCPRCNHKTRWTHALRQVAGETPSGEAAATTVVAEDVEPPPPAAKLEPVTAQCACGFKHKDAPEGEHGCGAPFSVVVSWLPSGEGTTAKVLAAAEPTTAFALADARDLQTTRGSELTDVRKSAESWRTGLGALLAILTATLFIKGKSAIDDIAGGWRWLVIVLALAAGATALYGAWQAIRAAYGEPSDVWLKGDKGVGKYGSLSAWRHAFAVESARRLKWARRATAWSLAFVAAATLATWLVPGPPPPAFVKVKFAGMDNPVCGELTKFDEGKVVVKKDDEHETRKAIGDVESVKVVKSCD